MVEAEGSGAMFPGFEVQLHLILSYVTMGMLPNLLLPPFSSL